MSTKSTINRYKREEENIIIEVAVKNSRQLFNERDPAPFRERDLDPQFVTYIVSAIQEFPLRAKMKIRIISAEKNDATNRNSSSIREAIQSYFKYESNLASLSLRKRLRTARFFSLIGITTLAICLSLAQVVTSMKLTPQLIEVLSVGLVIIGWVAMWHPIEALLYDWWPIREQRMYFEKIATLEVEVVEGIPVPE